MLSQAQFFRDHISQDLLFSTIIILIKNLFKFIQV